MFDPLGLLCPILIQGKKLLQTLWSKRLDCDDEIIETDIHDTWSSVIGDIEAISECRIPRSIAMDRSDVVTESRLLCFCVASSRAYATTLYLHQTNGSETKVNLNFAKSRLAPLKGMTIPKLELMAVLIGVRCLKCVRVQLKLPIKQVCLWTDSQCVLSWIKSEKELPVFVKNRVNEINSDGNIKFDYVPSSENPADIAS